MRNLPSKECQPAACYELHHLLPKAELLPSAFPGCASRNRRDSDHRRQQFPIFLGRVLRRTPCALSPHDVSGTGRDADDLITLIKKLFEEIGIHVSLQDPQRVPRGL